VGNAMKNNEHKLIHAHVYEPHRALFKSNKNDRSQCQTVSCHNSENCDLFKRKECSWIGAYGYSRCPYGTYSKIDGFTRRARKYYSWLSDKKDLYKDVLDALRQASDVMAIIGDFIYLPYSFMTMNDDIPFKEKGGFFAKGCCFLNKEFFNIDTVVKICTFRPQAMMGGEIKSYQKEEVPKFVKHLSEQFPDLYKELCNRLENISNISLTNVGREAYLNTLKFDVGEFKDIHGATWQWDGKYLISNNSHASFMLISKFDELRLIPREDVTVKITDDNQVSDKTIFYKS